MLSSSVIPILVYLLERAQLHAVKRLVGLQLSFQTREISKKSLGIYLYNSVSKTL